MASDGIHSGLEIGTPRQFRWLRGVVVCVLILNLADAIFTLVWVSSGLALEANPILRDVIEASPLGFMLAKLGLVSFGSWLLWRYRREPTAVVATFVAFFVYYLLLLYHLDFLSDWVRAVHS